MPAFVKAGDRRLDGGRGAADHRLARGCCSSRPRRSRRSPASTLSMSARGAKTAAILPLSSTDTRVISRPRARHRLEGVREGKHAGRHEGAVLAQAVAHDHVGRDPVGREQAGERDVGGEHRGLGDRGLLQVLFRPRPPPLRRQGPRRCTRSGDGPGAASSTRSASSNVSLTTGSVSRRPRSMFTYCEPWPVYRKATLGPGPRPRKTPWARSARQTAGLPPSSALRAPCRPSRPDRPRSRSRWPAVPPRAGRAIGRSDERGRLPRAPPPPSTSRSRARSSSSEPPPGPGRRAAGP